MRAFSLFHCTLTSATVARQRRCASSVSEVLSGSWDLRSPTQAEVKTIERQVKWLDLDILQQKGMFWNASVFEFLLALARSSWNIL
jgi:hypothetical protein